MLLCGVLVIRKLFLSFVPFNLIIIILACGIQLSLHAVAPRAVPAYMLQFIDLRPLTLPWYRFRLSQQSSEFH